MAIMEPTYDPLERLTRLIHRECLAPDGWRRIGDEVASAIGANKVIGVRATADVGLQTWSVLANLPPDAMRSYGEHWGREDAWYHGAYRLGRIQAGVASVGRELVSQHELRGTAFYNEFLIPIDIECMVQVCLGSARVDGVDAAISFYRGPGQGDFEDTSIELLRRLAPHLTIAAHNTWAADALRMRERIAKVSIDGVDAAVFGLRADGRLAFANAHGDALLTAGDWIRCAQGRLVPGPGVEPRRALGAMLHGAGGGVGNRVALSRVGSLERMCASLAPLSHEPVAGADVVALLWLVVPQIRPDAATDVSRLFELSAAEERVLRAFVEEPELPPVAAALDLSIHTVRIHIKNIFRKTGRRSQAELLGLVARTSMVRNA